MMAVVPPGGAVFERQAQDGAAVVTTVPTHASDLLAAALDLWRGEPLADFTDEPFAAAEVVRLTEQRPATITARIDADLLLGRHAALVSELRDHVQSSVPLTRPPSSDGTPCTNQPRPRTRLSRYPFR